MIENIPLLVSFLGTLFLGIEVIIIILLIFIIIVIISTVFPWQLVYHLFLHCIDMVGLDMR